MKMENQFYLVSRHGNCGSNVMFHNKDENGYGTNLDNLEVYSTEQAQKALNSDIRSTPLLKSEVDALAIRSVDCQYITESENIDDPNNEYIVQIKGRWNGNDVAFAVMGGTTYNLNKASIFSLDDAKAVSGADTIIWSKQYLISKSRRTFQETNINTRKMITGAGIKYAKPRKQRETTGKTRHNCPSCGKIVWDYNPYEAPICSTYCEIVMDRSPSYAYQPKQQREIMTTNMYSVIRKVAATSHIVTSFVDKEKARLHCHFLNKHNPEGYMVVPSEITLFLPESSDSE